jgi:ketosteroid isomerase-like protein
MEPVMPLEDSIHEFFDLVNRRDLDKMGNLLSPDAEFYFPKTQPLIGKERVLRFFGILFRQYPRLAFEIHRTIHQDNRSAVHWKNRGVNRKSEPYQNEGVTLLEWEAGKIRFISDFFKDTEKF